MRNTLHRLVAASTAVVLLGAMVSTAAAQTGVISGRVVAAQGAGGPLEAARVTVIG